jgi:hypothetical protein
MPIESAASPPVLSINNGATFMVADLAGHVQHDLGSAMIIDGGLQAVGSRETAR